MGLSFFSAALNVIGFYLASPQVLKMPPPKEKLVKYTFPFLGKTSLDFLLLFPSENVHECCPKL